MTGTGRWGKQGRLSPRERLVTCCTPMLFLFNRVRPVSAYAFPRRRESWTVDGTLGSGVLRPCAPFQAQQKRGALRPLALQQPALSEGNHRAPRDDEV